MTNTPPPARSLYRRIVLAVAGIEAAFLLGVIALAQIFHLDPTGDTYWKDATIIALGVLLIVVVPALLLAWLGGYALVLATPLAAFAALICLIPYQFPVPFEWPNEAWAGIVVLMMLCVTAVVRYEKKRAA